jgi:DNA-binding transcriptional LysR family regulator
MFTWSACFVRQSGSDPGALVPWSLAVRLALFVLVYATTAYAGRPANFHFTMSDNARQLDWEDVRYFVALSRHGRLSATARDLRVTHATVARRVTSLEAVLGRPLFERRADGYSLTADGSAFLREAIAMEEAATAALRHRDSGNELNGLVRLTAARALADNFLIDHLGGFHERYPDLDLELIGDNRVVSLARREADIALRLGSPKDSDLLARRLASIAFGLYASPAQRDKPDTASKESFIGYDRDSDFIFEASWLTRQFPDGRFAFRTNSQMSQAAAARAGFGTALLPRYLAANDPGLVPVPFTEPLPKRDVWLLTRRDLAKAPSIRAVSDYLVELFRRERHLLADD